MRSFRIVSATRYSQEEFKKKSLLGRFKEFIRPVDLFSWGIHFENTYGLSKIYNSEIVEKNRGSILVFVHDDVLINDWLFSYHLNDALEQFDVVGVVGNKRRLPEQPSWAFRNDKFDWDDAKNLRGYVCTLMGPRLEIAILSKFSATDEYKGECKLIDGLFIAVSCDVLLDRDVRFDEEFEFDFYDLDFCRTCECVGLKIGTWPIAITHASSGNYNTESWKIAYAKYREKWKMK
jgi:GT2 family glycosyltransferase